MFKFLIPILVINCFHCYAITYNLIIWNGNNNCVLNQLIPNNFSIHNILAKMADTSKPNKYPLQSLNYKGNTIKDTVNNSVNFVVYIGAEIMNDQVLKNCTNYFLKAQPDSIFYSVVNSGWSYQMRPDSTILQVANKDNHIFKVNTLLPNGNWFLYSIKEKNYYLLQEVKIKNQKIDGYVKEYNESNLIKLQKYKQGVLVDTLFNFTRGYLSSYEVRSNNGLEIIKSVSYYPISTAIWWLRDYIIGYEFTFFEDGNIQSMVRIKENNKYGTYLEFDEKSNVIKKKTYSY